MSVSQQEQIYGDYMSGRQTILTSQSGARGNLVLGKPTLLGA